MRRLDKPTESAEDVFLDCISLVRNPNLKARLTACKDLITEAAAEFNNKVTTGEVHTIIRESLVNGNLTSKELENIYSRMLMKDSPCRKLYDKLLSAPAYGTCPLCSHRLVTTIDHYLPKALYPRLAVVPINLIPACTDCNRKKLSTYPKSPEEETLHPYYDNIENETWLKARVLHSFPTVIQYEVYPPSKWDALLAGRVKYHFESLELNKFYSTLAAVELSHINFRLNSILETSGAQGVHKYLLEAEETRSHDNLNSWQTAMYHATAEDRWFCSGGFRLKST